MITYCHSNTTNMLFTTELAESLKNKGVYSFTSAPGDDETRLSDALWLLTSSVVVEIKL